MMSRLCSAALMLLLFAQPAAAAAVPPSAGAQDQSLVQPGGVPGVMPEVEEFRLIHADSMTLTRQKSKPQVFKGAVDIIMLDKAGNETQIQAEKVTIYYQQDQKQIDRMEAEGKVKIVRGGTTATTELAIYRGDKDMIELLVDPHVKDARGELTANKISIFMQTDEVVAAGNVRGLLYPESFQKPSQ